MMQLPAGFKLIRHDPTRDWEAANVQDFLAGISPATGLSSQLPKDSWIYRGHSDADWPLRPTARRKDAWQPPLSFTVNDTLQTRLMAEARLLLRFCEISDRQGLPVPGYHPLRLAIILAASGDPSKLVEWPPLELAPALGLAQHNGLPTCLLDFTRDPFIAAYFAARGVVVAKERSSRLCVWAIWDPKLMRERHSRNLRRRLLVPPASDNQTLQRQQGLFVFAPLNTAEFENRENHYAPTPPLEEDWSKDSDAQLHRVVLSTTHAEELLAKLIWLGYDSARLFPSYYGAVQSVVERHLTKTDEVY